MNNIDAIKSLHKKHHIKTGLTIIGNCEKDLLGVSLSNGDSLAFTFADVLAEKTKLQNAEPMRVLREKRNLKLAKTDWRASSDLTLSSEWSTYRQALRDLPSAATPSLDDAGNLQNVTWPYEPT